MSRLVIAGDSQSDPLRLAGGANGTRCNLGATTPSSWLGLGPLRTLCAAVPTPRTDGAGTAGHMVGSEHIERHAAPMRAVHQLRPQGRHVAASGLDRERSWLAAVSG